MKFTTEMFADLTDNSLNAHLAAGILNGTYDPVEEVEAVDYWVRHCFNRPSDPELKMAALNALFECHGVEAIRVEGEWLDNYHGDIIGTYINSGDTYAPTVVLDHESGEFLVTTYGDWLEGWERERDHDKAKG
jgi:hypothetical protein